MDVFLACDTDFRNVCGAHSNVTVAAADSDASIFRDGFRSDIQVEWVRVARNFNGKFSADCAPAVVDGYDTTQKHEHADDQQDFATRDTSSAGIVGSAGDGPVINLD